MKMYIKPHVLHTTYNANKSGIDYIVSDIHGMYDLFIEKLKDINFDFEKDRLFSVGDLIDRGFDSEKCLDLINEPWFNPVIGNHESMMIDAQSNFIIEDLWFRNGGVWFTTSNKNTVIKNINLLIAKVPIFITLNHISGKKIGICHAEPPTIDWKDTKNPSDYNIANAIWGRNRIQSNSNCIEKIKNIDMTIHGHTIVEKPALVSNSFFIDTGSYLHNKKDYAFDITIKSIDDCLKLLE